MSWWTRFLESQKARSLVERQGEGQPPFTFEFISAFATGLLEEQSLDDLLWRFTQMVGTQFNYTDCVLYLLEGDRLRQKAAWGPKNPKDRTIKDPVSRRLGEGIAGTAAQSGQLVWVRDTSTDPRYLYDHFPGGSEIAVPIIFQNQLLGVVDLEAPKEDAFCQEDVLLLQSLIHLATPRLATALEQEESIRREGLFRALAENVSGVVYLIHTGERERPYYVSEPIEDLTGYPSRDFIDGIRSIVSSVHPDDVDLFRIFPQESGARRTYRIQHRDGSTRWIEDRCQAAGLPDQDFLVGTMIDITERVHREEALRQAKKAADAANEAKNAFLANISHEIRTPLHAILGLAQLLLEADYSSTQETYLHRLEKAAVNLQKLVNNILDFSRIESGNLSIEFQEFGLRQLVNEVLDLLNQKASTKGVALRIRLDSSLNRNYWSDPIRLRQVLINLIDNAIKYTDDGEITIDLEIDEEGEGLHWIGFTVTDTGSGIPEDQLTNLFNPFTTADDEALNRVGGTGLGLAISKRIVEALGGHIECRGTHDGLTVFWFRIPLSISAERSGDLTDAIELVTREVIETPQSAAEYCLLIVDDDEINRLVARLHLETFGFKVLVAESGSDALGHLKEDRIHLVFMDCKMPEMDGYEATRRIRQSEALNQIPIVALTAYAVPGEKERCIAVGMNDILTKPFRREDLESILRKWLPPWKSIEGAIKN